MLFAKKAHIIPVINSTDINGGVDADSINCKHVKGRVTYIVHCQTIGGTKPTLYVYSGATDGAKTSALYFKYAYGSAAAGSANCDVLGTEAEVASLQISSASNTMLIVEVDVHKMDMANDEEWMTLSINADADSGVCVAYAIIDQPAVADGGATTFLT